MECRNLDITLISAKGIRNANLFSKMDVYAVVSIAGGDPRAAIRSPVDKHGGTNPSWNFFMKFAINDAAAQQNRLTLVIRLRSQRELGDRDIGEVRIPIKEIIGGSSYNKGENKVEHLVRYQVKNPNGKHKGELNLSYKFGDKQTKTKSHDEPVTAYPAKSGYQQPPATAYPAQGGYSGYRPPPVAGYGYLPQQAYGGYPPQGYGYPPMQQPPKRNKFGGGGMGLGAGLLGGALGGMLIGDMISDDMAYDAGFDDGGGF